MLAFADPKKGAHITPQVNPVSTQPRKSHQQDKQGLGTQHPRTGFSKLWGSGQP